MHSPRFILTLSCHDVHGIVAAVSAFLAQHNGFIKESTQYGDPVTQRFFMRVDFETGDQSPDEKAWKMLFESDIAKPFNMDWKLHDASRKQRVVILVSKYGHCLNDLVHRFRSGTLPIEIAAVISNHEDMRRLSESNDIPYHCLPVTADTKLEQESALWQQIKSYDADVVVLARYMQILSPGLSAKLAGHAINIHHSFLPSFKGAKPYTQAYERGVKIIGATAHYVTDALDEGPIIEQEVARVNHADSAEDLTAIGRDIESVVLARALKYHTEHRVLINGAKTVVFR